MRFEMRKTLYTELISDALCDYLLEGRCKDVKGIQRTFLTGLGDSEDPDAL